MTDTHTADTSFVLITAVVAERRYALGQVLETDSWDRGVFIDFKYAGDEFDPAVMQKDAILAGLLFDGARGFSLREYRLHSVAPVAVSA